MNTYLVSDQMLSNYEIMKIDLRARELCQGPCHTDTQEVITKHTTGRGEFAMLQYATPGSSPLAFFVLMILLSVVRICVDQYKKGKLAEFLLTNHPTWRKVHICGAVGSAIAMVGVIWLDMPSYTGLGERIGYALFWGALTAFAFLMCTVGIRYGLNRAFGLSTSPTRGERQRSKHPPESP